MIRILHSLEMLAVAALALAGVSLALAFSQQRSEAFYNQGRSELFAGNDQQALASFQSAIDSRQKQPMFYAAHALAVTDQLFGIAMPPRSWKSLPQLSRADSFLLNGTMEDYKSALKLSPSDATLWSNLGWIEAFLKNDHAALAAFRQATLTDPSDAVSRIGLGLFYERQGTIEDAMEQYARALVASARIVDSPFFKDLQVRNKSGSMTVVNHALELLMASPQSPIVVASIAKLHAYLGQDDLANREYNSVLNQLPNLSYTWTNLGLLALMQNNRSGASLDFQRALFLDGQNTIAANKLASIELADGNLDAAKSLYARTLLTPLASVHAERTWRIYHISAAASDDIVPAGLLYYISPDIQLIPLCGDWLDELSEFAGQSEQIRSRIESQENICDVH
jgi:tetratricopeptide (TPR) repeat protein